jgi:hypothetical protein
LILLLSLCACLLIPGCDKTKQVTRDANGSAYDLPQDPNLPNLSDPRYRPTVPQLPNQSRGQRPVTLRVSRLDFPLDKQLNHALRYALPGTDATTAALLKDNGLRVALLPMAEFETFAKDMGEPLNVWRSNLQMAYDGTPLATTPQIKKRIAIDMHNPQMPQETYVTNAGWFRLMLSVHKARLGDVQLGIVPQHYQPTTSVKVRSAMDKIWDGTLFDALNTNVTVANNQLLVICRTDRPTLAQYRQQNKTGTFDPEPGDNAMIRENYSMGDALLTYDLWNHPAQMVFVIARTSR